jgi:hypothetical protein
MRRICATLLLLAALAPAQEMFVPKTSIDMMPSLEEEERNALYRVWYDVARRLKGQKGEKFTQLRVEFWRRMIEAGLDEGGLERLRAMPRGVLREERYNHGVVLEAPDLSEGQRAILTRCISTLDGAQLALHFQREQLSKRFKEVDEVLQRQVAANFRQQHQQMEKRFWHVVNYALTPAQMHAVRKLLSPRYSYVPQPEQQLYLLSDITPSQATRIRALFVEHGSETTADTAEVNRIRTQLRRKDLSKGERAQLRQRQNEAGQRLKETRLRLRESLRAVLTEKQIEEFRSLPPMLDVNDRRQGLRKALKEMRLTPEQQRLIAAIRKQAEQENRKVQGELKKEMGGMQEAGLGPESPQMMTMQMMQRGAQAKMMARVRELGGNVVVGILEPGQVSAWIVAPGLKP